MKLEMTSHNGQIIKALTRLELLQDYYEHASYNLLCYSKNYLMTEAREGYEQEWTRARQECKLLQDMIAEEKRANRPAS